MVQAEKTIQPSSEERYAHLGSQLKFATWNTGGLSFTNRELCKELNYDILALTETHDNGTLKDTRDFIKSEPAPKNDPYSGVSLLLSDRLAKCVMHTGNNGSRIVYARVRAKPSNLFVIGVYLPHSHRKEAPFFSDTLQQLEEVLHKVSIHDCIIVLGDMNCKLARNTPNLTGRWCVHKRCNKAGEEMLEMMRRSNLCATSTMFQPARGKSNATFLPRDPQYNPSQIDYILISSRWATGAKDSKVRWGPSIKRWGRLYDHGLVSLIFTSKIKSRKPPKQLDYSSLKDQETQKKYEEAVQSSLEEQGSFEANPSEAYANLCTAVKKAAQEVLPIRKPAQLRKRHVSVRTRELYATKEKNYNKMEQSERKNMNRTIFKSCRNDYRKYIDSIIQDMEAAERVGNTREITRLTKTLTKSKSSNIMPSKDLSGNPITTSEQLLTSWNEFLSKKFAVPASDVNRRREHVVSKEDILTDEELDKALSGMKTGKAPGWDDVPVELYQNSKTAKEELFRIIRLIYDSETVPPELVRGVFIMLYKKKDRNDFSNYRAICLLCHAYKLLSAVIANKLHIDLEHVLPDSQAGFRKSRGTRDNICILKWTIKMLLRENREAVVTFIDYSAAFDTESQLFLDEALGVAGVSGKVRRVIQAIFSAAQGCVRTQNADGTPVFSDFFDILRGVLQGDIFSPVTFIAGLWRIFCLHDIPNAGVTVGQLPYTVHVSKLEYADDAGLIDETVAEASVRISSIARGSEEDAAMSISIPKTKGMHVHERENVSATTEEEVIAMNFSHKCDKCSRTFPTQKGMRIHQARFCNPRRKKPRSRTGTLADKAVQQKKRKKKEAERDHVTINGEEIENVPSFEYLGSLIPNDGDDETDVKHRMDIAQSVFSGLFHIWRDHRLPVEMKLRLYICAVCSTFTHASEAWDLTGRVKKRINGFNSRCLHIITGKDYRDTAVNPDYNLMLAIRKRRLRYVGHILRMEPDRLVRKTLCAYVNGGIGPLPEGSLLMDCPEMPFDVLTELAGHRGNWEKRVANLEP